MNLGISSLRARSFATVGMCLLVVCVCASGQDEKHGRKYQPPPATAHIVVAVQKDFNGKPLVNAAVVFRASKDGKDTGYMEVKTDSHGNATMDFIEAGSHVTVQVIAGGYATDAEEFDVTAADKNLLVKMKRPQAQVSEYQDNSGKSSTTEPGVQERVKPAPVPAVATPATAPVVTPQ
jgi:hypothetical protein